MGKEDINKSETNKKNKDEKDINKNTKKKKKKRSKFGKIIRRILLIILIILIIFAIWFTCKVIENGGGLKGFLAAAVGHNKETLKNLDRINVLVMGESGVGDGYKLADSIMVVSYNPKNQQAALLSIPRDTYVGSRDKETATQNYLTSYKINAAYRNGTNIPETVQLVKNMLGIDLQYYLIVDTDAVIKLVDAMGGVTFNVPIDMEYDDETQNLHINLKAGEQLLNGEQAEQLLRFRHNNDMTSYPASYGDNDIGRMRTQREFIEVAMKQLLRVENIFKISDLVDIAFDNINTNLSIDTIKDYVPYIVEFNPSDLKTGTLPGQSEQCNGIWIYDYSKTETAKIVKTLFEDEEEITDEEVAGAITEEQEGKQVNEIEQQGENEQTKIKAKIEILNGTGSTSTLKKAAEALKEAGFDVTKTGKSSTASRTTIINRTLKSENIVEDIKDALGVGTSSNGEDNANVDFTIILGKDYIGK